MLPAPSDNIPHATAKPSLHTWHDQLMSVVFLMLDSSPAALKQAAWVCIAHMA